MPNNNICVIKIRPETETYDGGIHLTPAEWQAQPMPYFHRLHRVSSAGSWEYTAPSETSRLLVSERETDPRVCLLFIPVVWLYCRMKRQTEREREREREWLEGRKGGGSDLFKYDIPYSSWVNDETTSTLGHVVIHPRLEARTFGIIAWAGFD